MLQTGNFADNFMAFVINGLLAFIIAFSATPMAKKLAFKIGAVDVPKDGRRMHTKPIARLGGIAIVAGFTVSILLNFIGLDNFPADNGMELLGLFAGALIIVITGIVDDIRPVNAKIKLLLQIAAALAVIFISGTRIESITNPFSPAGSWYFGDLYFLSYFVTVLWIVGVTNAINLIDGLDGLAAGVSAICSLSLFFISITRNDIPQSVAFFAGIVTTSLAGSALGFLPFNFHPAKIFMGDTGATFLGFVLAVISIHGTVKSYAAFSIALPLIVLGLPLLDTVFAVIRRILGRKPIMTADRGHLHHRLIDMGLSHKQTVAVMYTASSTLGICAIVLANRGTLSAIVLLLSVSVFIIGGAKCMRFLDEDSPEDTKNEAPASSVVEKAEEAKSVNLKNS